MEKESICQKILSFYEKIAKRVVILNLAIEISIFITCCIIFLLFGTLKDLYKCNFKILDKELQNIEVYKGISLIILFISMLYFAYNSVLISTLNHKVF